jgi:hypothetical protein
LGAPASVASPNWHSGSPGGSVVRLDAVLAEQLTQAIDLAVQPQVLTDNNLNVAIARQLVFQPYLVGKQLLSRSRSAAARSRSPAPKAASFSRCTWVSS